MASVHSHTYAEIDGFRPLKLDLRLPSASEALPVVIWIHGGGWRGGDRGLLPETMTRLFDMVADAGFALASLDYRLSGEAVFPAQLDDVREAVRWLRLHAKQLGIDMDRGAVWGESAGGQLASLLALTAEPAERFRCAVVLYAPSDMLAVRAQLPSADTRDETESSLTRLLGGTPAQVPEVARAASAVTYVHAGAPPMLLLHGDADTTVPIEQSALLAERLTGMGATAVFEPVPGAGHIFTGYPEPHDLLARAIEFTARYV